MIKWAGWIITLYGTAHTIGALTVEKAAHHAGTWFSGGLWDEDFTDMSPAGSAYWLSLESFGIPLILIGLTILWLERRGITPPVFIAWTLGAWTVVDAVVLPFNALAALRARMCPAADRKPPAPRRFHARNRASTSVNNNPRCGDVRRRACRGR